jgi:beta-mannanase
VAAWQDAYKIIHPIALNVLWVWNVSTGASPSAQTEKYLSAAYPGNAYVDYISFDSYVGNTETSAGSSKPWTDTQTLYNTLTQSPFPGSAKPVMVPEFSIYTSDSWLTDSTRAAWITNTFKDAAAKQPDVVSMNWFNGAGPPDAVAAFDNTSYPLSQAAFDQAVDNPPYS